MSEYAPQASTAAASKYGITFIRFTLVPYRMSSPIRYASTDITYAIPI